MVPSAVHYPPPPLPIAPTIELMILFLIVLQLCPQWDLAQDDETVKAWAARIFAKSAALAEREGLLHRWMYPNYATKGQDVYAGFGEENRRKMKEVQRKYDPEGIFDRLQPGYFKV